MYSSSLENAYRVANYMECNVTPQERAEWDYKTAVGVAKALAESKVSWVPEVMISGDTKGGNGTAMDAVSLNMMLEVVKKLKEK